MLLLVFQTFDRYVKIVLITSTNTCNFKYRKATDDLTYLYKAIRCLFYIVRSISLLNIIDFYVDSWPQTY